jgi:hypothetical protein
MIVANVLQVVVALGLVNVWLLRLEQATSYRGGNAQTLKEEFAAYGLAPWVYFTVGALKLSSALLLIVGLWVPMLALVAATVVAVLMVGALRMHLKINDPFQKSIPAFLMLVMNVAIASMLASSTQLL